jgi:3-oxoacyl-[acyl-carrier-protein] synthase-1
MQRVFVTGIGIITSIGNNVDETYSSLKTLKSGINEISMLDTVHKNKIPAAEVKLNNEELFKIAGIEHRKGFTRTTLLGIIAAREAIQHSKLTDISNKRVGLISATSAGGIDKTEKVYFNLVNSKSDFIYAATHDCADSTIKIAETFKICGHISTISTACSASANSIMVGMRMIQHGLLDKVIAGGTDSLSKFTLNGFNSLMILSKGKCKPFDEKRDGITLGEGAGYLVIESENTVVKEKKNILCELKGYGNACDAFHHTATSPEGNGPYLAMSKALKTGNLLNSAIDYINAHGTGTVNNDLSESKAIERLFGKDIPPLSSTKGFTGHCLGASGGIEAVISILTIINKIIFPNIHFEEKMQETTFSPISQLRENIEIKNVLSNSFGFGGNNTTLIFSRS